MSPCAGHCSIVVFQRMEKPFVQAPNRRGGAYGNPHAQGQNVRPPQVAPGCEGRSPSRRFRERRGLSCVRDGGDSPYICSPLNEPFRTLYSTPLWAMPPPVAISPVPGITDYPPGRFSSPPRLHRSPAIQSPKGFPPLLSWVRESLPGSWQARMGRERREPGA